MKAIFHDFRDFLGFDLILNGGGCHLKSRRARQTVACTQFLFHFLSDENTRACAVLMSEFQVHFYMVNSEQGKH